MAIAKVILNSTSQIDLTSDTVTAESLLSGYTAHDASGTQITGTATAGGTPTLQSKTATPTTSSQTITPDSGYDGLSSVQINAMPSGTAGMPTASKGSVSNHSVSVTPSVTNTTGYITGGTKTGTAVTVSASELVSGTKTITENGTGIDVTNYASVDVNVAKTYTVTLTSSGHSSYCNVLYNGNTYYSSGDTFTVSENDTITVKAYSDGTNSITINDENVARSTSGAMVTYDYTVTSDIEVSLYMSMMVAYVTITELGRISSLTITENGTYTASGSIRGYSPVTVNVPSTTPSLQSKTATPSESQQTVTADSGYDGLSSVTVGAISSTYVGSGIDRNDSSDLTVSGATVTAPSGYYESQASKTIASGSAGTPTATKGTVSNHSISVTPSVTNTTGYITGGTKNGTAVTVTASELASGNKSISANGTGIDVVGYSTVSVDVEPNLQAKTNISPTTSSQTITADSNYDGLSSVQINAMPSGSASTPATTITANPTISVSSGGLITATASASQNVTPSVSEGYVSSGTAGTIAVSGSKTQQLTTTAATTITPTKSSQTAVASGVYTTGAITVGAIPSEYITTTDATATASDIVSGETAYVNGSKVTGSLVVQTYRTGTSAPSSSLGVNGDIYLRTS